MTPAQLEGMPYKMRIGLFILLPCLFLSPAFARRERYANFSELAANQREGVDYEVEVSRKGAPITVLAIHGGALELQTEEIARAIAGDTMNLYVFRAKEHNWNLHVTSRHFDDPRAVELTAGSVYAVSIHGWGNDDEVVCIGGANGALRDWVAAKLSSFMKVENPCAVFPAPDASNIVNRAQKHGVQLEISRGLRLRMKDDPALFHRFTRTVCEAMLTFSEN